MNIFSSSNNSVGIDIGSTSIKILELKKEKNQLKLVNYGFSERFAPVKIEQAEDLKAISKIIKKIIKKTGINPKEAYTALPTFSVFTSILNLSNVAAKDIASAVHWEAKKVIPLPLEQMILDWKQIDQADKNKPGNVRVLLTGAPRDLVKKYVSIFKELDIHLKSMETETFSLIRSLLGKDKTTSMLVELGGSTSDISIVDKGIPMLNRSVDVGGVRITEALNKKLNISTDQAEQFKFDLGVGAIEDKDSAVPKAILEAVSPIVNEIKYAIGLYQNKYNKKTEKIILSGGSAILPGLEQHLSKVLDMKVVVGNPWSRISCQLDLKPLLDEIGPRMAVSVGLAMYGFSGN